MTDHANTGSPKDTRPAHRPRQDPAAARVRHSWRVKPETVERIAAEARRTGESAGQVLDRLAGGEAHKEHAAKRMRLRLDNWGLAELRQMRELRSLLLAVGFDIDLYALCRAWGEMSRDGYCAQWMDNVSYTSTQTHPVLDYLEPDT